MERFANIGNTFDDPLHVVVFVEITQQQAYFIVPIFTSYFLMNALITECMREPLRGIGKPEPLAGHQAGWWTRRINQEQRLVYRVIGEGEAQALEVAQCRYHYGG